MRRHVLIVPIALLLLAVPERAAAQNTIPLDCSNLPSTSDLRIVSGFAGKPVTLRAGGGFYPGCDNPTDTYTVLIGWGDGTTSVATPIQDSQGRFTFSESHVYAAPGTYQIVYTQTNNRTGVSRSDNHYQAAITSDLLQVRKPFRWDAARRFKGKVVRVSPPGDFFPPVVGQATISWGDGTRSRGTVISEPGGGFSVKGSHRWKKPLSGQRKLVVTLEVFQRADGSGEMRIVRPLKVGPPAPD